MYIKGLMKARFGLVYCGLTQHQPGSYQGGEMPEETTDLRSV